MLSLRRQPGDPLAAIRMTEEYQTRVAALARYNSERTRGIVHTADWTRYMAQEQAWFDDLHRTRKW